MIIKVNFYLKTRWIRALSIKVKAVCQKELDITPNSILYVPQNYAWWVPILFTVWRAVLVLAFEVLILVLLPLAKMQFIVTQRLHDALRTAVAKKDGLTSEQLQTFQSALSSPSMSLETIIQLSAFLRKDYPNSDSYWLHELLRDSAVYHPPPPKKQRVRSILFHHHTSKLYHELGLNVWSVLWIMCVSFVFVCVSGLIHLWIVRHVAWRIKRHFSRVINYYDMNSMSYFSRLLIIAKYCHLH